MGVKCGLSLCRSNQNGFREQRPEESTGLCVTGNDRRMRDNYLTKGSIGKSIPLQARSGPEISRKLRFPDFMTTAQDGGKVVSLTHRPPLPPVNAPGTHFC